MGALGRLGVSRRMLLCQQCADACSTSCRTKTHPYGVSRSTESFLVQIQVLSALRPFASGPAAMSVPVPGLKQTEGCRGFGVLRFLNPLWGPRMPERIHGLRFKRKSCSCVTIAGSTGWLHVQAWHQRLGVLRGTSAKMLDAA